MDILSVLGVAIAFAAIIGGNFLEGGHAAALVNLPAAVIVFGGTIGAAILQTPSPIFRRALEQFRWAFFPPARHFIKKQKDIVHWADMVRRGGLLRLEKIVEQERDPFSKKAMQLLIDGMEPERIRSIMELELMADEKASLESSKVYDAMGGYAPTIGIIGAVMGLIHVMGNLDDPSMLGTGIATAFVATIYGVGFANLFLLPIANKLRAYIRASSRTKALIIEGIVAIAEGENPRNIKLRLEAFNHGE